MTTDKDIETVEVEVLPKGWDEPQSPQKRQLLPLDFKNPMTWLLIPPALIFAFGLILWAVGNELQRRAYGDKE